ncbi:MAG: hypothetical protein FJ189_08065, partial [Gammaproteobacteria bacterium]|nr:hypothetical protein [Gammaproteobacteria bacterium]
MASIQRMIIGITGATGIIFGVRLLELLRDTTIETHLIVSKAADRTRAHELSLSARDLRTLASVHYAIGDVGAGRLRAHRQGQPRDGGERRRARVGVDRHAHRSGCD